MHNITFAFSFTVYFFLLSYRSVHTEMRVEKGVKVMLKQYISKFVSLSFKHFFPSEVCICEREQSCPLAHRLMCLLRYPGHNKQPNCPAVIRKSLKVLRSRVHVDFHWSIGQDLDIFNIKAIRCILYSC